MRFVIILHLIIESLLAVSTTKRKAETARLLAHSNLWGVLSTTSVHLDGRAWGQPKSFVDGSLLNSTGTLYFYDSDMDESIKDLQRNVNCSFAISMENIGLCTLKKLDPEDPRCVRVTFSGQMVIVADIDELTFAVKSFYERHPAMKMWPKDHHWRVRKLLLDEIWLIDTFGGATIIDISEYYAVQMLDIKHF